MTIAKIKEFPGQGFMVHVGPVPISLHQAREDAEMAAARFNRPVVH